MKKGIFRYILSTITTASLLISVNTSSAQAAFSFGPSSLYIVKISPAARAAIETAVKNAGGTVEKKYQYVFDGFTIKIPDSIASFIAKIPNVLTIEKDGAVSALELQQFQSPVPSWGLDRIDQRDAISIGDPNYKSSFGFKNSGINSIIYIGDTGVSNHLDLEGRLSTVGYDGFSDGVGISDCNGHGTHVATTAAGATYGVAKKAKIVSIRLLNCAGSGRYSDVISALDWILSPSNTNSISNAVLNLSIGGSKSIALNDAITRLTNS